MPRPPARLLPPAIGWALLSQAIWLPLLIVAVHDRLTGSPQGNTAGEPAAPFDRGGVPLPGIDSDRLPPLDGSRLGSLGPSTGRGAPTTGLVLGSPPNPAVAAAGRDGALLGSPVAPLAPLAARSAPETLTTATVIGTAPPAGATPPPASIETPMPPHLSFSAAEQLGGTLRLSDLDAPSLPPLVLAERARWSSSGDPMAPLPPTWRDPVRRAISDLPADAPRQVATARVAHVPSARVSRPTPVPLALQSDGSVDILSEPDDPAVVEEIASWSMRQTPPEEGTVAPAIVHLEPLPAEPAAPVADVAPAAGSGTAQDGSATD